ncbi:MAG: UDP-N-acetylmuramate dehydrogenase [Verrucomicrobiota bacterium]
MMMLEPEVDAALPEQVALLGIGGMGMAPLALYLAQAGCRVSGWDDDLQPSVRKLLEAAGIEILDTDAKPQSGDVLVYSSAVAPTHPVMLAAGEGVRCVRRGVFLAEIAAGKKLVAIVGSHGKTTTTGMLIDMLAAVGLDFSYVLGARFQNDARLPAHYSAGSDWLVAEVDESDGTIEDFSPEVTVVVNVDWDHADRYGSEAEIRAVFEQLLVRTRAAVVLPDGLTTGTSAKVSRFKAEGLNVNLDNASAALEACRVAAGRVPENPLASFPGIARRQDILAEVEGVRIMADYAHHPTEIRALLSLVREERDGPVWVVFQPHRYTRTQRFAEEFAQALNEAERAWVLPVYAASEPELEGGHAVDIVEAGEHLQAVAPGALFAILDAELASNCTSSLLFVGAGDIDGMAKRFVRDWQRVLAWREQVSSESKVRLGEPLAKKTTIGIGGRARYYAEPASEMDLAALLKRARDAGVPILPMGRGSNLIVSDSGYKGLVIALRHKYWKSVERLEGGQLKAGAGVRLKELCSMAAKHELGGFAFLEGIPGTVGGSLRMNAGAMGGWIFDLVKEVTYLTAAGELVTRGREDFHAGYRCCQELIDAVALSAVFEPGESVATGDIRRQMDTYAQSRKESQPREPSAGCMFKNPEGNHAGKLIDELGLKGLQVGGAAVSQVHANFVINTGGARAEDVINLVREIRARVKAARDIELEPEALLVGQRWQEVLRDE